MILRFKKSYKDKNIIVGGDFGGVISDSGTFSSVFNCFPFDKDLPTSIKEKTMLQSDFP